MKDIGSGGQNTLPGLFASVSISSPRTPSRHLPIIMPTTRKDIKERMSRFEARVSRYAVVPRRRERDPRYHDAIEKFTTLGSREARNEDERQAFATAWNRIKDAQPPSDDFSPRLDEILRICDESTFDELCDSVNQSYSVYFGEAERKEANSISAGMFADLITRCNEILSRCNDTVRIAT